MRRTLAVVLFAGLLVLAGAPAGAHHKPGHGTTTTAGPTTTTVAPTTTTAVTTTTVAPTTTTPGPPTYGADAVLGEALEPCETVGTQATPATLASVLAGAQPGSTILLRAGSYAGFTIPAGTTGQPITVKPYSCEAVTITSQFTMQSWTVLAGVKAESAAAQWLTRIGSTTATPVTDVTLRNSTVRGGTTEAIRIRQNARNITLSGLDVEGGRAGHGIKVHYEATSFHPAATITNTRIRKRLLANGGIYDYSITEDLIQLEGHEFVTMDRITFGIMQATGSAEDGLDVKTGVTGFLLTRALFEGPFGAEAMIIQASNDANTVRDSKVVQDSLSVGASNTGNPTATLERLVFEGGLLQLRRSGDPPRPHGVRVIDTAMQGGTFKLGTTATGDQPHNAEFVRLTLTGTNIITNVALGSTWTCTDSTLTGTTGDDLQCT